jgi:pyridine nucleotide-disulfide oxidoreductase family protein
MMKRLVLVGAGHAHAHVLKTWPKTPMPDVELVLVSPQAQAPYSGMVPGWLAGVYRYEDIVIDFAWLCQRAGVRWMCASLSSLEPEYKCVTLSSGERLPYDLLSLNVGSTLTPPHVGQSAQVLSLRPLAELHSSYEALLAQWHIDKGDEPYQITAVGGGAAGFESLLAIMHRLRSLRPDRRVQGALMTRSSDILPSYPVAARRAARRALQNAGVNIQLDTAWCDQCAKSSDLVLWATGAQAQLWQRDPQRRGELAVSPDGYVQVDRHLRSVSHPTVFAVGDCAQWADPLPKSGVHAVRMGPVLAHNLQAALVNKAMQIYKPQTTFLSLLATQKGQAIASRGDFSLSGRWAWTLKDWIDTRFVRRFSPP